MAKDREVKYNGSGYYDPTPYEAIKRIEGDPSPGEAERFKKVLKTIFMICEISGFTLEGRITLKDNESGRVWR